MVLKLLSWNKCNSSVLKITDIKINFHNRAFNNITYLHIHLRVHLFSHRLSIYLHYKNLSVTNQSNNFYKHLAKLVRSMCDEVNWWSDILDIHNWVKAFRIDKVGPSDTWTQWTHWFNLNYIICQSFTSIFRFFTENILIFRKHTIFWLFTDWHQNIYVLLLFQSCI